MATTVLTWGSHVARCSSRIHGEFHCCCWHAHPGLTTRGEGHILMSRSDKLVRSALGWPHVHTLAYIQWQGLVELGCLSRLSKSGCSGAADMATGIGGWPAPEIAKLDATLPEQWWQPQALACLEGALSSLCLPAMSASLGASPHQGEPFLLLLASRCNGYYCCCVGFRFANIE